ncbi:MAG TPA: tetratricopeptide repeat protein, partial [Anaeromyxobacteraceae bacterium]
YAARLGEARQDRAAGRLAAAIAGYRQALALLDTSGVEAELGGALREAAQPVAAIDALRRAVELDAANAAAYIALGEVYLGERRPADARWAFERYLSLEPQGGRAPEVRATLERMK